MNTWKNVTAILFTTVSILYAQKYSDHKLSPFKPQITYRDHTAISVDHGDVLIYDKNNEDDLVEITEDNKLYVQDKLIRTNPDQQALTQEYRERMIHIKREVDKIAYEGAKIGLDGAKIGLKAVVGVFRLILPDYDSEDLKRDMNEESSKIEAKAKILEARANVVDSSVVELEKLHYKLRDKIPELKKLDWF